MDVLIGYTQIVWIYIHIDRSPGQRTLVVCVDLLEYLKKYTMPQDLNIINGLCKIFFPPEHLSYQ